MKGFGHVGQGGPFSSSSNLSPLAPPFTVDPSNPRPRTSSFGHLMEPHFTEALPYGFGVRPPHENWTQLHPPTSVPNSFPGVNPVHATGLPSGNVAAYDQIKPNFFSPQSYLPQYPQTAIPDNITSMGINERGGMISKSGVAPLSPGGGLWSGMSGGEQWRKRDMNITGPPASNNLVKQGIAGDSELPAREEHSDAWLGKSAESLARKSLIVSTGTDFLNSKSSPTSEESTEVIPFNMSRTSKMPYPQIPSPDLFAELWSQVNSGTDSREQHLTELGPHTADPMLFYPSTANTSRMYDSPAISSSSKLYKAALSSNMNPIEQPRDSCDNKRDFAGHTLSNTTSIQGNFEGREGHADTSNIGCGINRYKFVSLNSSPISNDNPIPDDSLNHFYKEKNKLHTFSLEPVTTAGGDSIESASEMPDQFNSSEDSPCWRGASGLGHTLFGVTEAVRQQPQIPPASGEAVKKQDQVPSIPCEAGYVSSPKVKTNVVYQETGYGLDGSSSFPKQPSSFVGLLSAESSGQNVKAGSDCSKMNNKDTFSDSSNSVSGFEFSGVMKNNHHDGTGTSRQLGSDGRVADFEKSDCHVECVSTLPCSGCTIPANITDSLLGPSDTFGENQHSGIDVQLLVKAIHNLSELLVSCCSKNVDALKEQDHVVIQNVTKHLDACISKNFGSKKSVASLHTANTAGRSQATNTEINNVQSRCKFQNDSEEKGKLVIRLKDKFVHSSSSDGKDCEQDDHMTQAIKHILEENFQEDEESHQQISLYKNLWLETEATLCSMKYKARFADMKIKMEKYQHCQQEDVASSRVEGEKLQSLETSLNFHGDDRVVSKPKESIRPTIPTQGKNQSSSTNHAEDVDATIMARFQILKSRVENSVSINKDQQLPNPNNVGTHLGEETLCKGNAQNVSINPQLPQVVDLGFAKRRNPWPFIRVGSKDNVSDPEHYVLNCSKDEADSDDCVSVKPHQSNFLKEFDECVLDGPLIQSPAIGSILGNELQADGSSSSSEWEHILKEPTWQT